MITTATIVVKETNHKWVWAEKDVTSVRSYSSKCKSPKLFIGFWEIICLLKDNPFSKTTCNVQTSWIKNRLKCFFKWMTWFVPCWHVKWSVDGPRIRITELLIHCRPTEACETVISLRGQNPPISRGTEVRKRCWQDSTWFDFEDRSSLLAREMVKFWTSNDW